MNTAHSEFEASLIAALKYYVRAGPQGAAPADLAAAMRVTEDEAARTTAELESLGFGFAHQGTHRVLKSAPDGLGALPLLPHLGAQFDRFHLVFKSSTGSTNDDAMALAAEGAPHRTAVIAAQQTAGRGRDGRAWFSPPGANVYLSFVVRTRRPPPQLSLLPLAAAVATADACRDLGAPATIKWPNDIRVDGQKLGGILCQTRSQRHVTDFAVAGVGLNINLRTATLPPELRGQAASLAEVTGAAVSRSLTTATLLESLDYWFGVFERSHDREILDAWRAMSDTLGAEVAVTTSTGTITGRATGITGDGRLIIDSPAGPVTLATADIIHLRDAAPARMPPS